MERYLSANDAARILNVTTQTVHIMVQRGDLRVAGKTESGIRLFTRDDVEELAAIRAARVGHPSPTTEREASDVE